VTQFITILNKCKTSIKGIDHLKKKLKRGNCMKAKGDCPDQVLSDQIFLGTVRQVGGTM
jgi:hypothetical protein